MTHGASVESKKTRWLYYVEWIVGYICAQPAYFLHSTMPSVTCLRLSDVSVICRVTYVQFPIQSCFSLMSVSQAAQRRTWFTQYRTSDVAENLGMFLVQSV